MERGVAVAFVLLLDAAVGFAQGARAALVEVGEAQELAVGGLAEVVADGLDLVVGGHDPVALALRGLERRPAADRERDVVLGTEELLDDVLLEEDVAVEEEELVLHLGF